MNKDFTFDQFRPAEYSHDPLVKIPFLYEQERKACDPFDKRIAAISTSFFKVANDLKEVRDKLSGPTSLWEFWCLRRRQKALSRQFDILNDLLNTLYIKRFVNT